MKCYKVVISLSRVIRLVRFSHVIVAISDNVCWFTHSFSPYKYLDSFPTGAYYQLRDQPRPDLNKTNRIHIHKVECTSQDFQIHQHFARPRYFYCLFCKNSVLKVWIQQRRCKSLNLRKQWNGKKIKWKNNKERQALTVLFEEKSSWISRLLILYDV